MRHPKTGKLSFGEKMREWRKARREYADKVKTKVKEEKEIESRYPPQPGIEEKQSLVTSPTESTESKVGEIGPIPYPKNHIERAINRLREQAQNI